VVLTLSIGVLDCGMTRGLLRTDLKESAPSLSPLPFLSQEQNWSASQPLKPKIQPSLFQVPSSRFFGVSLC